MTTDTSKITGAADDLSDKLTKGGSAAKTLGVEIANAIKSLDSRVTAIEAGATTPPVTPPTEPPPTSTKGKITNFKGGNAQTWQIDGKPWTNVNANRSHCLTQVDDYAVRFENRSGDVWEYDSAGNNRNEVGWGGVEGGPHFREGVETTLEMTVTIEPGPRSTSGFCDLCQVHAVVNNPPSPFYLDFSSGDFLEVVIQKPKGAGSENVYVYKTPSPLVRGRAYNMRAAVMMKPAGGGYARVWLDGAQIANYTGAIGANNSEYWWRFGLYRVEAPEVLSAVFRNVSLVGMP